MADAASTTTTVSVRRNVRKELQTDEARTLVNPSFARRPAAAPAAAGSAAPVRARSDIPAAPGTIATMLTAAVRHLNAARRPSWIALIASAVAAGVLVWWVMIARQPTIDASAVMRDNLVAAQEAVREGRFSEPPERSALHYYTTVLALDPANAAAIGGIDRIADHYIDEAKRLIIDGQFAPAALALERVRRIRPDHRRLPLLDAQLRRELKQLLAQEREAAAAQAAQALSDAAQKQAAPAKPRAAKTADPQSKSSGQGSDAALTLAAAVPAASPTLTHEPAVARLADTSPTALSTSVASEGASRAPENVPEASVRKAAASPSSADAAAAGIAAAAGAAAAASTAHGTDEVAVAPIAVPGAGAASGAAVGPESTTPPAAAPAPEKQSAPAPKARALLRFVQPEYPSDALMRGYEGWVDLALDVTPAGVVLNPRIEDASSGRIFNRAALAAVRQWRYQPRDGGGTGEPEHIKVRVQFKLDR